MTSSGLEIPTDISGDRLMVFLVNRIITSAPPAVSRAIRYCAITHWFDVETIGWMKEDEQPSEQILDELTKYTFVRPHPTHGYTYHENIRNAILSQLQSTEDFGAWHAKAVAYFEQKLTRASHEEVNEFERERVYHLLASDEEKGFALFDSMFREAERFYRLSECHVLISMAREWKDIFSAEHQLWLDFYDSALDSASGKWHSAEEQLQALWSNPQVTSHLRYRVALNMGTLNSRLGKIDEAIQWNKDALEIARENRDNSQIAFALYRLGSNYKRLGDFKTALELEGEGLSLFKQELNVDFESAEALLDIGNTLIYMDRLDEATEAFQESLRYFEKANLLEAGETKHRVGWLQRLRGRLDESLKLHQEAIAILESAGEILSHGRALHSMGNVLAEQHDHTDALIAFADALAIFEKIDAKRHGALVYKDRSWSLFRAANTAIAIESAKSAIKSLEEIGDKAGCADGNLVMGRILLYTRRLEDAQHYFEVAHALGQATGSQYFESNVMAELALLMAITHRFDEVEQWASPVEAYARSNNKHNLAARLNVVRGAVAFNQNNLDSATTTWEKAFEVARTWNNYYPLDVTEQIVLVLTVDPQQAEQVAVVTRRLIDFLERSQNGSALANAIRLLQRIKALLGNVTEDRRE